MAHSASRPLTLTTSLLVFGPVAHKPILVTTAGANSVRSCPSPIGHAATPG